MLFPIIHYKHSFTHARTGDHLLAHNFYTNKMDATAYNDLDAVPRHSLTKGLDDHGGSRQRLLFTRKEIIRCETTLKLNKVCGA
jgi:hypothetical protein